MMILLAQLTSKEAMRQVFSGLMAFVAGFAILLRVSTYLSEAKALWTAREKLDYGKLLYYAKQFDSQVVIKRLGYLLDKLGIETDIIDQLRGLRSAAVSPLDTEVPNEGKISTKWSIRQIVDIETIINAINN
jgi:predicted transcriptional regulator of viral defense system